LSLSGSQRFAVLLCKFSDAAGTEPQPVSHYQDMFAEGNGGLADYWANASLAHIDLRGSNVFGWKVLGSKRDDYVAQHPDRWSKIKGAIDAFPEVDTSKYTGVVAVFNVDVGDSANQNNGVLCGPGDPTVTFLGHETGHVFGLEHSFDQSTRRLISWSAPGEYYDMHDVMSAMNVYSDGSLRFSPTGPLLATPNLDRMGWLDAARVWTPSVMNSSHVETLDLVSLGHFDRPGYLAAKVGGVYVEFRTKDGWDAAIPRDAVLIHELRDPNEIVVASDAANFVNDWQPGQRYGPPPLELAIQGGTEIDIDSFDLEAKTARITVSIHARRPIVEGPGVIFGGVAEGGGFILLPSGKIVRVPPRSPVLEALGKLAIVAEGESLSPKARRTVERAVFDDVAQLMRTLKKSAAEQR
jgi:hypothetical protein